MKKFIRNLFSGYFLILLILLIEVGFFIFVQFFFDDLVELIIQSMNLTAAEGVIASLSVALGYGLMKLVAFIVGLLIFFKIVNREEDPEFKIPWIVGMLLFPFFCSVLFLIFGKHELSKKDKLIIKATRNAYNAHFDVEEQKEELGRAFEKSP